MIVCPVSLDSRSLAGAFSGRPLRVFVGGRILRDGSMAAATVDKLYDGRNLLRAGGHRICHPGPEGKPNNRIACQGVDFLEENQDILSFATRGQSIKTGNL